MKSFPEEAQKFLVCDTVEHEQKDEHLYIVGLLNVPTAK